MKLIINTIAVLAILFASIKYMDDPKKSDEEAIKKLIQEEHDLFSARDYEGWAATWLPEMSNHHVYIGKEFYHNWKGWDEITEKIEPWFEREPTTPNRHETIGIRIEGSLATSTSLVYPPESETPRGTIFNVLKKTPEGWKMVEGVGVMDQGY